MSRYERKYGTDWEEIDRDEAVTRAYALGVAATFGEYHPEELDDLRGQGGSAYNRSLIDLAYQEGKSEGKEIDDEDEEAVWNELVIGDVTIDPDDPPIGGRSGLPEAMDITDALDRPDRDSTDAVDLPDFLQ